MKWTKRQKRIFEKFGIGWSDTFDFEVLVIGNRKFLRCRVAERRDIYRLTVLVSNHRAESNYVSQQWSRFERIRVHFYLSKISSQSNFSFGSPTFTQSRNTTRCFQDFLGWKLFPVIRALWKMHMTLLRRWYSRMFYVGINRWRFNSAYFRAWFLLNVTLL